MQTALAHLSLEARARDCARALRAGIRNPGALRARPASPGRGIGGSLSPGRTNPANRAHRRRRPPSLGQARSWQAGPNVFNKMLPGGGGVEKKRIVENFLFRSSSIFSGYAWHHVNQVLNMPLERSKKGREGGRALQPSSLIWGFWFVFRTSYGGAGRKHRICPVGVSPSPAASSTPPAPKLLSSLGRWQEAVLSIAT